MSWQLSTIADDKPAHFYARDVALCGANAPPRVAWKVTDHAGRVSLCEQCKKELRQPAAPLAPAATDGSAARAGPNGDDHVAAARPEGVTPGLTGRTARKGR